MSQNASSPPLIVDSAAMTEDDLYRENVNRLMQARSTEIISNGLPRHAAALFECFFRNALSEVKIVCSNLQREVFDAPDVLSSFASAARRGVSIQILVQNAPAEGSEFVKLFSQLRDADHGSLCIETEAATKSPMAKSRRENFAVMDRKSFRYEVDPSKCEAVASMNLPAIAVKLCQVFDRLYASVQIPGNLAAA